MDTNLVELMVEMKEDDLVGCLVDMLVGQSAMSKVVQMVDWKVGL